MILSIGEFVLDVFLENNIKSVKPGGAPFNVFSNVLKLEGQATFLSAIGNDNLTNYALEELKEYHLLDKAYFKKNKNKETSQAMITLKSGERSFKFLRDNNPDDLLTLDDILKIDLTQYKIVHFGSLMLSSEKGFEFLKKSIKYLKENYDLRISFDVNFRSDIYQDLEIGINRTLEIIKMVDLIKISEDELRLLSKEKDLKTSLKNLFASNKIVFLTLGKEGSIYYSNNLLIKEKSFKITPLDTTGAGDAFYSYVLKELDQDMSILESETKIKKLLKISNLVGALTTLKLGAFNTVPSLDELRLYLENHLIKI